MQDTKNTYNNYVKRIISEYNYPMAQILFQQKKIINTNNTYNIKEPIKLFILNHSSNKGSIESIRQVIFEYIKNASSTILHNQLATIKIAYKIYLLVQFKNTIVPCFLVLPDDIPEKCTLEYSLPKDTNKKKSKALKETLQVTGNNFVYTADIPFNKFDNPITFYNKTKIPILSHISLDGFTWKANINTENNTLISSSNIYATPIELSLFKNINVKIQLYHQLPLDMLYNEKPQTN